MRDPDDLWLNEREFPEERIDSANLARHGFRVIKRFRKYQRAAQWVENHRTMNIRLAYTAHPFLPWLILEKVR
jgi:hypothetical protein